MPSNEVSASLPHHSDIYFLFVPCPPAIIWEINS
jgi:hypothetical protein